FNLIFSHFGPLDGAPVADLFAGSGALGIEALSRGAASVVFVERDVGAARTIRANLAATGLAGAIVVVGDVWSYLRTAPAVELAFADPPYGFSAWGELGAAIRAGFLVAEAGAPVDPGPNWKVLLVRRYGGTVVTLAQPRSDP
ncbi:MAG: RsmD family RNA methyltransferase, partial [Acidimicrobiales bacterium]